MYSPPFLAEGQDDPRYSLGPLFPYLENGNNTSIFFTGLLSGSEWGDVCGALNTQGHNRNQ